MFACFRVMRKGHERIYRDGINGTGFFCLSMRPGLRAVSMARHSETVPSL
ncbi:MAG: hypothetical protein ACLSAH_17575 [Bilophila wadsworthia]